MIDKKKFLSGIIGKVSILMGGAVLVTSAQATMNSGPVASGQSNSMTMQASGTRKPFPEKLTLKQQNSGFRLIAEHSSHSSHASHASHASHSSHASRAS
jgi:hypothetical protein